MVKSSLTQPSVSSRRRTYHHWQIFSPHFLPCSSSLGPSSTFKISPSSATTKRTLLVPGPARTEIPAPSVLITCKKPSAYPKIASNVTARVAAAAVIRATTVAVLASLSALAVVVAATAVCAIGVRVAARAVSHATAVASLRATAVSAALVVGAASRAVS